MEGRKWKLESGCGAWMILKVGPARGLHPLRVLFFRTFQTVKVTGVQRTPVVGALTVCGSRAQGTL